MEHHKCSCGNNHHNGVSNECINISVYDHAGHARLNFDKIIQRCETWLNGKVTAVTGFSEELIRERLAQVLVATSLNSYMSLCASRLADGKELVPPDDQVLKFRDIVINPLDGELHIKPVLFFRSILSFVKYWLQLFSSILIGFVCLGKQATESSTLFYGLTLKTILYKESDSRFIYFCRNGPIKPLAEATKLIIQVLDHKGSISDPNIIYCYDPIANLICNSRLSINSRLRLLCSHLIIPLKYFRAILRFTPISLLGKDIAYTSVINALNQRGLIDVVLTTNSECNFQPLWMRAFQGRKFTTHMIWYSQNTIPLVYASDPIKVPLPNNRYITVDQHWVWTQGYKDYLRTLGHQGEIHVVGPIMWYLPEESSLKYQDEFRIAVFDITPLNSNVEGRLGIINNYHCTEHMLQFIREIIEVCDELMKTKCKKIRVLIKYKRPHILAVHDKRYIEYIQNIVIKHQYIELVSWNENIYSLLNSCDLSISFPCTSPAYISSSLKKKAIYFDPTEKLLPTHEPTPFIRFVSGKNELAEYIKNNHY